MSIVDGNWPKIWNDPRMSWTWYMPTYTYLFDIPLDATRKRMRRHCATACLKKSQRQAANMLYSTNAHQQSVRFLFSVRVFVSLFRMNFWREVIKMVLYPPSVRISFFFFSFFVSLTAPFLCSQFGLDAVLCFIIHRIRSHHLKLPASEEKKKKKSQQRKETFLHLSSKKFSLLSAGA